MLDFLGENIIRGSIGDSNEVLFIRTHLMILVDLTKLSAHKAGFLFLENVYKMFFEEWKVDMNEAF